MKYIGYCRVSTLQQNVDVQKDLVEKYCRENNIDLVDIIEDTMSGKKESRPGWDKVMYAVEHNNIDGVVFVRADRIARSVKHLLSIVEKFKEKDIEMISINDPMFKDLSSPQGKLIITVMGAIAEFEADLIADRMKEGRERAKIYGVKFGRPEKKIDWNEYDKLINLGATKRSIAKKMDISENKLYSAIRNR